VGGEAERQSLGVGTLPGALPAGDEDDFAHETGNVCCCFFWAKIHKIAELSTGILHFFFQNVYGWEFFVIFAA
jgi:hypothetical protein